MEAGTLVALYAAVVATAALGWNVARAILDQRTDVRLEVEHTTVIGMEGPEGFEEGLVGYRIEVVARNFGPREVVEDVGFSFEPTEEGERMGHVERLDEPLLTRDYIRWTADLKDTSYDAREHSRRFRGFVKLASGKEIASEVQEIEESSVEFAALDQPDGRMHMHMPGEEPEDQGP